jgi:hypothetical protein
MLSPESRLTLIDAMAPPAGFSLSAAMGVTFTLDLRALLAAPAAFALATTAAASEADDELPPIDLLHAVRAHAGKLTVFSQAGEMSLPPSRKVFAFLERCVIPVRAPRHGVVHPKVWVLRYVADGAADQAEARLRVLVASRNLTFDVSWDTIVRLDESTSRTGADLSAVGTLFKQLASNALGPIDDAHRTRVHELSEALRRARFTLPEGVDALIPHIFGFERRPSPLPADAARALVISPFLGSEFFTELAPVRPEMVVSRAEALDGLSATAQQRIETMWVFDDGSASDPGIELDERSPRDPGRPLSGLHAKVLAFETERHAHLFLGSANATGQAFRNNVEILLELIGPHDRLGIDALLAAGPGERGLESMFLPYRPTEPEEPPAGAALDRIRRGIGQIAIDGAVTPHGEDWLVSYRSQDPLPAVEDLQIECWPLSVPASRTLVAGDQPLDVRFLSTIDSISGFLAFELTAPGGISTGFVVPVALAGVPAERDQVLMRHLVGSQERFLRYLLASLEGRPEPGDPRPPGAIGAGPEANGGAFAVPVLERLLRAMREDRRQVAALHPLVCALHADQALPDGFAELWSMVWSVAFDERWP